jgi:hypothetical protein
LEEASYNHRRSSIVWNVECNNDSRLLLKTVPTSSSSVHNPLYTNHEQAVGENI